jgi:protein DGCR14
VVLDEDEYVARLDAIITREYFPDVPKLRDTLRWLRATNSGDPARVREAQRAIQRRLDRERGAGDASPSFSLRLGGASDDHTAHTAHTLRSPASAAATLSPWDAEAEDQWRDRDPEGFPDARRDVAGDARSAPATPSRGFRGGGGGGRRRRRRGGGGRAAWHRRVPPNVHRRGQREL